MTQRTTSSPRSFTTDDIEELDQLTYKRFRHETNQSQSFSPDDAQRLRDLVSTLWKIPKAGPGDLVAGAILEEVVGKGAFGTVWKGREPDSGKWRAVKIFDVDRLGDGLAVHLFRRGVRAMLYLRKQNDAERSQDTHARELSRFIVRIREVEPHMLAFSMDWLPDGDLSQGSIRGRPLSHKLQTFRHIAQAVHYAHTRPQAIVHRDIKPQNIVMDGEIPILTDFDIADMAFAKTLSRRAVGGAFAYAAPEQLSGECEHLEKRSDIYSLGRLLHFFLLERDPPILIAPNPPLEELNAYPEGIVKIIRRCTHRDLPMRYADINELLEDLDKHQQPEQVGAFGPNLTLAQQHWRLAETHAAQHAWHKALHEASQAQKYLEGIDEQQSQAWSFRTLRWRIRAGEWKLLPRWTTLWFRRLPFPAALLLILTLLSPLSIPLIHTVRTRAKQDKLEAALSQLTSLPSLQSTQAQHALAFLNTQHTRRRTATRRLVQLLSQTRGKPACRIMHLLYALAPHSNKPIYLPKLLSDKVESLYQRRVGPLLDHHTQYKWGPIRCPSHSRLPGLTLTGHTLAKPKNPKHRWLQWHAQHVDLRFLHATSLRFTSSNFAHSDFRMATLNHTAFNGTNLSYANFAFARMRHSSLAHATAIATNFRFADLRESDFNRLKASFADFRMSRLSGANLRYATYTGALFHANALPTLRQGGLDGRSFRDAICLSGDIFLRKGPADQCHQWHLAHHTKHPRNPPQQRTTRPPGCPKTLGVHSIILSFPPGQLQRQGACPWHQNTLPSLPTPTTPTSRAPSRSRPIPPGSQPTTPPGSRLIPPTSQTTTPTTPPASQPAPTSHTTTSTSRPTSRTTTHPTVRVR